MDKYLAKCFTLATGVLPERLWRGVYTLSEEEKEYAEEFRVRAGRQLSVVSRGKILPIMEDGLPLICTKSEVEDCIARATKSSVHAFNHQIKQGFVPLGYGSRMGICGAVVEENGAVRTISDISSLNIRIARQIFGVADGVYSAIKWDKLPNVLIISAAGGGKTTFLRDLIRRISRAGKTVGLADERFELAACREGIPTFDVGDNTDVLSGGDKEAAIDILVRTMSPKYIAVDEITAQKDCRALEKASYTGSGLLATAHCGTLTELDKRPVYKSILDSGLFTYIVEIVPAALGRGYLLYEKGGQEHGKTHGSSDDYCIVGSFGAVCAQDLEK